MSMKPPTPEQLEQQLQEAEAEQDRVREANRELQKNFCPVSLGDWLDLCRRAEIPHVPATQVTEVVRDDYLAFDTEGEHRARLEQVWKAIQTARAARKDNQMMRLDCCTDEEVKYRMSRGGGGGFQPEFGGIIFGDMRSFDMVGEYPRDSIPIWQRPWAKTQVIDGYPVEYRAFVRDGKLQGISSYYPQRPLPWLPEHLKAVRNSTERLIQHVQAPFLWHHTLMFLDNPLDRQGIHFTADFLVTTQGETLFLEGGPPHELGGHMCCFRPGEIEGVALTDRNIEVRE